MEALGEAGPGGHSAAEEVPLRRVGPAGEGLAVEPLLDVVTERCRPIAAEHVGRERAIAEDEGGRDDLPGYWAPQSLSPASKRTRSPAGLRPSEIRAVNAYPSASACLSPPRRGRPGLVYSQSGKARQLPQLMRTYNFWSYLTLGTVMICWKFLQ